MQAEGFEYWAMPPEDGDIPKLDDEPLPETESDEIESPNEAIARNRKYREGLDPVTRQAYGETLLGTFGPGFTIEHSSGAVISYPASGCLAEARLELLGKDDYLLVKSSLVELEGLQYEIDDLAYASPEYQDGTEELQICLREQGFELPEMSMDIEGFLNASYDQESVDAVHSCADELDLAARLQELQDRAAYELLQDPRVQATLLRWAERRDAIAQSLDSHKADLLGT